ncbi:PAS domain-containing protein [Kordiimonas lacus]|uniref:PAS domain-containing protein n=1 Tax=Kordiimonas lacus TaxID=637679 RepID=A0A1G6XKR6_9PROT|nr:PAS domain-containing protein [Kordiimonas lacus]SDD78799.1 PAS domain-containing protein [Kordiimonas lacus]
MDLSHTQKIFLDYWNGWLEKAGGMPARKDLNVRELGKYLPHVVIFDILNDPHDFCYRLVGTEVRAHTHGDYTGKKLSQMKGKGPGSKIWSFLDQVSASKQPLFQEVPYVGPQQAFLRSTLLFLPLADDHQTPNKILLVSNFISKVS